RRASGGAEKERLGRGPPHGHQIPAKNEHPQFAPAPRLEQISRRRRRRGKRLALSPELKATWEGEASAEPASAGTLAQQELCPPVTRLRSAAYPLRRRAGSLRREQGDILVLPRPGPEN